MGESALVLGGVIALVALVGSFVLSLAGPFVVSPDASVPRRSVLQRFVSIVPMVVVAVAFAALGLGPRILEPIVPEAAISGAGVDLAASALLGIFVAAPAIAISLLTYQLHAVRTDSSVPVGRFLRLFLRVTAFAWLVIGSVLVGFLLLVTADHPVVYLLVPVLGGVLYKVTIPIAFERGNPIREPTEEERAAIEAATAISGGDPDRVRILEDRPEIDAWRPFSRGWGPTARVYVPETFFEEVDPEVLETVLVRMTMGSWFGAVRVLIRGLSAGLFLASIFSLGIVEFYAGGPIPVLGVVALFGSLGLLVVGYLLGRVFVFRHDDRVADAVGADRVVQSLRCQNDLRGNVGVALPARVALMVPSSVERINRQLVAGA